MGAVEPNPQVVSERGPSQPGNGGRRQIDIFLEKRSGRQAGKKAEREDDKPI
jgi:hypothetical protein